MALAANNQSIKPSPRTQAGMTSINDFATTYMCQSLPFGGVKESGFDRFAGIEGLRGLCVPKAVAEDRCERWGEGRWCMISCEGSFELRDTVQGGYYKQYEHIVIYRTAASWQAPRTHGRAGGLPQ